MYRHVNINLFCRQIFVLNFYIQIFIKKMSDLFSIYEDSLNIVLKNIQMMTETMNNLSKEKTESALEDGHKNIQEAERIV